MKKPLAISIPREQFDGLPFGLIRVERDGTVLDYNAFESRFSGIPADKVVGRNFFSEIAPCTNVPEFRGRFDELAGGKAFKAQFRFYFPFRHDPREVTIDIRLAPEGKFWIFVAHQGVNGVLQEFLHKMMPQA